MEEIQSYINQIQQNLSFSMQLKFQDFQEFETYEQIYYTMFSHLSPQLQKIKYSSKTKGKKIQALIDILAEDILTMDLSHIQGEMIVHGDHKHLLNFIQLLFELSRMFAIKSKSNFQSTPGSRNYSNEINEDENRRHSIMGVNQELNNFMQEQPQQSKKQSYRQDSNIQQQREFQEFAENNPEILEMAKAQGMRPEELLQLMMQEDQNQGFESGNKYSQKNQQSIKKKDKTKKKKKSQKQQLIEDYDQPEVVTSGILKNKNEVIQSTLPKENFNHQQAAETAKPDYNILQMDRQSSSEQGSQDEAQIDDEEAKKYMVDHWNQPELDEEQYLKMLQQGITEQNIYNKQQRHKAIEKQIYTVPIVESRHAITDPKKQKKQKKRRGMKHHQQQHMVEQMPFEQNENQEPNIMHHQPELEYSQQKHSITPHSNSQYQQQQDESDEDMNNLQSRNPVDQSKGYYEILSESVNKIKNSLNNMREIRVPEEDPLSRQKLIKQRNEYKRLLKDFLEQHKINESSKAANEQNIQQNLEKKLKNFNKSNNEFLNQLENDQKSLYYKLRDEKVNYLRKIHRIIFELEKKKIIDEKDQYKKNRQQRNIQTQNMLDSIENAYRDKINMLKEKLKDQKLERHLVDVAQKEVISKLEKEMKDEQQKQISELKNMWNCEKEKFNLITKDDGFLEKKIVQLYKKY